MRHELHKPSVNQNPRRNRVENAIDNQRRLRPGCKRLPHAQPNGYRYGRRDRVAGC
jgi:hypothetical protein